MTSTIQAAIFNFNNVSYLVLDHDEVSHNVYVNGSFKSNPKAFIAKYKDVKAEVLADYEDLTESEFVEKYNDNNPGVVISEIVEKSEKLEMDRVKDTILYFEDCEEIFDNVNLVAVA